MWPKEGARANRNPVATILAAGFQALQVNPVLDLILGRFCWVDLNNLVTNARVPAGRLGIASMDGQAIPVFGRWQKLYRLDGLWHLRGGMGVTVECAGDFWARFAGGISTGQRVYANDIDGSAAALSAASGYTATKWTAMQAAIPGELTIISSHSQPSA